MQVNNTTQTSNTTQVQNNTNVDNSNSAVFNLESLNNKDPKEITFKEYQQLSYEDIEKLFGKDNYREREASKLLGMAQFTDNETLNEVFFENTLKVFKSGGDFINLSSFAILSANPMDTQAQLDYIFDPDNIENMAFTAEQKKSPFFQELLSKKDGYIPPKPAYENQINIHNSEQLLEYFHNFKKHFEEKIDSPQKTFAFDVNKLFQTVDGILDSYKQKVNENNAVLTSYTRTNTTNPANKVEETNIPSVDNEVSPADEKLFKSITEDNYISYDEIKNLSYEQIVQIKDFVMQKDADNNYIPSTFMEHDKKAGMLLGTVSISKNDTFNKAVFNIARKIDDEKLFNTFIYDMTGTKWSDKLMAHPEFQEIDYTHQDPKEYLSKKMASYQIKLDTATDEESKEFYQDMINRLQGLTNHYKTLQGESIHDNTDPLEKLRALVEDLISVIKTGFTPEELEYIEKLIAEIKKLLKERSDADKATSNEDINKQIKAIEDALLALEKKMHGVAIIEMDGETTQQQESNDSDETPSDGFHFEERLNAIEQRISSMKNGDLKLPTDTSARDEEEKEEAKEW